jgi:hypothetical protein
MRLPPPPTSRAQPIRPCRVANITHLYDKLPSPLPAAQCPRWQPSVSPAASDTEWTAAIDAREVAGVLHRLGEYGLSRNTAARLMPAQGGGEMAVSRSSLGQAISARPTTLPS